MLLACAGDDEPASPRLQSQTPRITADDSVDPDLGRRLLNASDLRTIGGFGEATTSGMSSREFFENPDPRGPCGAPVVDPGFDGAALLAITGRTYSGFQSVMRPVSPTAEEVIGAQIADARLGCPPHESETNMGTTQVVTLTDVLDVPDLPERIDDVLVIRLDIRTVGQSIGVAALSLRAGDVLSSIGIFGADGLSDNALVRLAGLMAERLVD